MPFLLSQTIGTINPYITCNKLSKNHTFRFIRTLEKTFKKKDFISPHFFLIVFLIFRKIHIKRNIKLIFECFLKSYNQKIA